MLIVALVLAVIGLAALVTAVVTSNELVAWVCIAASVLGVILLIVDAIRERHGRVPDEAVAAPAKAPEPADEESASADAVAYSDEEPADTSYSTFDADYPDESLEHEVAAEDHPEELVSDDPESDLPDDDEPELPEPAEEAALHTVDENDTPADEDDDLDAEGDEPDKR
jgi:hypothetical protein